MNSTSRSVGVRSSRYSVPLKMVLLAGALIATGGCQSTTHETGQLYGVSQEFDGHVGQHMPLVFGMKNPRVVVTLCQNTAGRPGQYSIHVAIRSSNDRYEPQRLDFIADGTRISLADAGAIEASPKEKAANYPISLQDLETLAGARNVKIRIKTTAAYLERDLAPMHVAALDSFYVQCVQEGSAPRHAALDD